MSSSSALTKSILTRSAARTRLGGGKSTAKNHELCDACHGAGHLICCDGCPRAFHFNCVNPPLDYSHPPDGEWYCNVCLADRKLPSKARPGPFSELVDSLHRSNPIQYQLPQWIKDSFEDVSTEPTGQFIDLSIKKYPKLDKFGMPIEPDYTQLQDEKGEFIYCHWCRKSPSREMPAIPCDYCSMYWHLDCLDPPMVKRPSLFKKWMCPCHVNHLLPKTRRLKNTQNDLSEIFGSDNTAIQFEPGEYDDSGQYCIPAELLQQMKLMTEEDDWDVFGLDEKNPRNNTSRYEIYGKNVLKSSNLDDHNQDFVGLSQVDENEKGPVYQDINMPQNEVLSDDGSELTSFSDLPSEYSETEVGGKTEKSELNDVKLEDVKKKKSQGVTKIANSKQSRNNSTPKNSEVISSHFMATEEKPISQGSAESLREPSDSQLITKPSNLDPQFMGIAREEMSSTSSKPESVHKRKADDWDDKEDKTGNLEFRKKIRTANKEQSPEKSPKPNSVPVANSVPGFNNPVPPDQNLWVLINAALNDL